MNVKKISLAAASVAAVAALAVGGSAIANAADNPAPTTSTTQGSADTTQQGQQGQQGRGQGKGQRAQGATGQQASPDTPVTGDEATKVSAAVTAKDSTVTIDKVQKDEDGSYDATGTKADGTAVRYDVSADLATITEGQGGHGGKGGGGSQDTPVTGDEAQKVIDAVKAEDSSATIDTVRKDPDGSYDALGTTSDGAKVMFEVSADLATITQGQGGQGGQGGPRGQATGGSTTGGSGAAANGTAGTATPTLPSN